jgi:hypothetical protein
MNITRYNYEEFFLLYTDNELSVTERKQVEEFILNNPDLEKELELFQQYKLSPEQDLVFENKESLLKSITGEMSINAGNCESFFVLYADDELSNEQKAGVEDFVYHHPQFQAELELIQQLRLRADTSVVYPDRDSLYRKEQDDKVVPFRFWKMAAAAILLLLAGWLWLNKENLPSKPAIAVTDKVEKSNEQSSENKLSEITTGLHKQKQDQWAIAAVTNKKEVKRINSAINTKEIRNIRTHSAVIKNLSESTGGNIIDNQLAIKNKEDPLKSIAIASINETDRKIQSTGFKASAAIKKPITDQPMTILHPDDNDRINAAYASYGDDNIEIMNTTVNKKNSLRGFLRKASRFIAKKTEAGEDNGNRKGILIGSFEIAVK